MSDIVYPKIGELITTERAVELCRHFGFDYLVERISAHPEHYRPWVYDGVSCVPDQVLAPFVGRGHSWQDVTNECALPHDLQYAFGNPANQWEKAKADHDFAARLQIKAGMQADMAEVFHKLVETFGGAEYKRSFSFGFARIEGAA